MFFRIKKSGPRAYVQVVENRRVDGAVRQSVVANLGRADDLIASGALASLLASGAKLTDQVLLISALEEDADGLLSVAAKRIGGPLLFGRIWDRLGIAAVLEELLKHRAFEFAVERAVFVATLHRLFVSGSDRDCSSWMEDYAVRTRSKVLRTALIQGAAGPVAQAPIATSRAQAKCGPPPAIGSAS